MAPGPICRAPQTKPQEKQRFRRKISKRLNFSHQIYSVIFISYRNRFYMLENYFDSFEFLYYKAHCHSWNEGKHLKWQLFPRKKERKKKNYQESIVYKISFAYGTYYVGFKLPSWTQSIVTHFQKGILKNIFLLAVTQKGYSTHFYPVSVAIFHWEHTPKVSLVRSSRFSQTFVSNWKGRWL